MIINGIGVVWCTDEIDKFHFNKIYLMFRIKRIF